MLLARVRRTYASADVLHANCTRFRVDISDGSVAARDSEVLAGLWVVVFMIIRVGINTLEVDSARGTSTSCRSISDRIDDPHRNRLHLYHRLTVSPFVN